MPSTFILLSSLLLSLQPVPLQGPDQTDQTEELPRVRVMGKVRHRDGSPWAGAKVTLHSWLHPGYEEIAGIDRIDVVTDKRGRFKAMLLEDRRYLAWAVEDISKGAYRTTQALSNVQAGQPLILTEASLPRRRLRIKITDSSDWAKYRPLSAMLTSDYLQGGNFEVQSMVGKAVQLLPIELDEKEEVLLPAVPWRGCVVEIFAKSGLRMTAREYPLENIFESMSGKSTASPKVQAIAFPTIVSQKIRALADNLGGKPIHHAKVYQRYRGRRVLLGETNEEGIAELLLPKQLNRRFAYYTKPRDPLILIQAKGYGSSYVYHLNQSIKSTGKGSKSFRGGQGILRKGVKLEGRLLYEDGVVAAKQPLLVHQIDRYNRLYPYSADTPKDLYWTDEEGRFEIDHLNQAYVTLQTVIGDRARSKMPRAAKSPLHSSAILAVKNLAGKTELDLGDIKISELQRVDLQVDWTRGEGAELPQLEIFNLQRDHYGFKRVLRLAANRRGRVSFFAPPSEKLRVLADIRQGFVFEEMRLSSGKTASFLLKLPSGMRVSGVVKDKNGDPLPFCGMYIYPLTGFRGDLAALQTVLRSRMYFQTDDTGRFTTWVPEGQGSWRIYAQYYEGKRMLGSMNQTINLDEKEERQDIEIVLPLRVPAKKLLDKTVPAKKGGK